jgi:hypothetical protein
MRLGTTSIEMAIFDWLKNMQRPWAKAQEFGERLPWG